MALEFLPPSMKQRLEFLQYFEILTTSNQIHRPVLGREESQIGDPHNRGDFDPT